MNVEKVDKTLCLAMEMACAKVEQLGEVDDLDSDCMEDLMLAVGTMYKVIKAKKKLAKLEEKKCDKGKDKDKDKEEDD